MATIDSLVEATIVGDNDLLLIDQGGEGKKLKKGNLKVDADNVPNANGGSVQDFMDAQYTTVAELATGKFQVGQYVRLIDRAIGLFLLKSGGIVDGYVSLDAGNGNTAELQADPYMSLEAFGYSIDANIESVVDAAGTYSVNNNVCVMLPETIDLSAITSIEKYGAKFVSVNNILSSQNTFGGNPRIPTIKQDSYEYLRNGMYKTPAELGIRCGTLTYAINNGRSKLISDLSRLYPKGYNMTAKQAVANGLTVAHLAEYGDDANSGADFSNAKRSFAAAMVLNPHVIYIDGGHFDISDGWNNPTLTRDMSVINVNQHEKTIFTSRRKVTWSDNGNGTWTSSSLGGTPISMFDRRYRDSLGDLQALTRLTAGDTAGVATTPWSWCRVGSGASSTAYVNINGLTPSDYNSWVNRSTPRNLNYNSLGWKFYSRGIHWAMGDNSGLTAFNGNSASVFINEDCKFSNSYLNDGLRVQGVGLSISIKSSASKNAKDGFNYHAATNTNSDTIQTHFIEIDCTAYNHYDAAGTSNGTTAHEDCRGFRLGGDYGMGIGPSIADINTSKTYNVMCCGSSGSGDANASGILAADGTPTMWLHGCSASKSRTSDIRAAGGAIMYICATDYGSILAQDSASISTFTPDIV